MGPGWELPSHQDLIPSHPGPGLAWDRELSSHQDLVLSRSRSWLGMSPGAPISQRFGLILVPPKKIWSHPIPISSQDETGMGWELLILCQECLYFIISTSILEIFN